MGHLTPEYDFFRFGRFWKKRFWLNNFFFKINVKKLSIDVKKLKKRGGLSTHHRKIPITLRIFFQLSSNSLRLLTRYRTTLYYKIRAVKKYSQSYDFEFLDVNRKFLCEKIGKNFVKTKKIWLQIFRIWQIYVLLTLSK